MIRHVTAPRIEATSSWQSRRLLRTPRDNVLAAWVFGITLLGMWIWWALAQGAFFGTVMLPGSIVLFLVLALMIGFARFPVSPRGPHAIAFLCFSGLAAWTALSIIWSPAQDLALDYAQRGFVYAAAFAIGLLFAAAPAYLLFEDLTTWDAWRITARRGDIATALATPVLLYLRRLAIGVGRLRGFFA